MDLALFVRPLMPSKGARISKRSLVAIAKPSPAMTPFLGYLPRSRHSPHHEKYVKRALSRPGMRSSIGTILVARRIKDGPYQTLTRSFSAAMKRPRSGHLLAYAEFWFTGLPNRRTKSEFSAPLEYPVSQLRASLNRSGRSGSFAEALPKSFSVKKRGGSFGETVTLRCAPMPQLAV